MPEGISCRELVLLDLMDAQVLLWAAPSASSRTALLPAGLCGMVAISWYAANITQDFFNPLYAGTK